MENNTYIKLELTRIDPVLVKADVKVVNAPSDFFGAAFDLVIQGGDWSLKSYEAGEMFNLSNSPPLMLAMEKDAAPESAAGSRQGAKESTGSTGSHRIVAGLSLKRGMNLESGDGNLITFYIKASDKADLKFSFSNNILSALRDGKRVDLGSAIWTGAEMGKKSLESLTQAQGLRPMEASLAQTDLLKNFQDDNSAVLWWESPVVQVYIFLGIALAVMLLVVLALILAKKFKFD